MGDRRQLGSVASCIVVKFKQWDGKELHVLWNSEDLCKTRCHDLLRRRGEQDVLLSGICTRNNFLHSLGFVICAGMKGYCI